MGMTGKKYKFSIDNYELWASERAQCKILYLDKIYREKGITLFSEEKEREAVEKLRKRLCLLPRRSVAGVKAYFKRHGWEEYTRIFPEVPNYNDPKYHGVPVFKKVKE